MILWFLVILLENDMLKKFVFSMFLFLGLSVHAQPIEFVVTASPGGPDDTVTRKIAEKIETSTKLQIVVVNKPGGAHTIGYGYVQNSTKPTLVFSTPEIAKHPVYDEVTNVFSVGYFHNVMYVSKKSGVNDIKDFNGVEVKFGHGGMGSFSYSSMKHVCEKQLKCLDVPFKSAAEGMLSLMSGTIDAYAVVSYGSKQYAENDKIKAIYNIKLDNEKSWGKIFAKNISKEDLETIRGVLKSQGDKFYIDMGFGR